MPFTRFDGSRDGHRVRRVPARLNLPERTPRHLELRADLFNVHARLEDHRDLREVIRDLAECQDRTHAERLVSATHVQFAEVNLHQLVAELPDQPSRLNQRRINLLSVTEIEAETSIRKAFKPRPQLLAGSSIGLAFVHVFKAQHRAEGIPTVRITDSIGMKDDGPSVIDADRQKQ